MKHRGTVFEIQMDKQFIVLINGQKFDVRRWKSVVGEQCAEIYRTVSKVRKALHMFFAKKMKDYNERDRRICFLMSKNHRELSVLENRQVFIGVNLKKKS